MEAAVEDAGEAAHQVAEAVNKATRGLAVVPGVLQTADKVEAADVGGLKLSCHPREFALARRRAAVLKHCVVKPKSQTADGNVKSLTRALVLVAIGGSQASQVSSGQRLHLRSVICRQAAGVRLTFSVHKGHTAVIAPHESAVLHSYKEQRPRDVHVRTAGTYYGLYNPRALTFNVKIQSLELVVVQDLRVDCPNIANIMRAPR